MTGTIGSWLLCAFLTPRRVFRGAIREWAQGRACRRTRGGEKEGVGDGGAAAAVFACLVFRQWCMNTMSEDTDSPSIFLFFLHLFLDNRVWIFLNRKCGRPAASYSAGAAQGDLPCETIQSLSAAHLARRGGDWQNYHTSQKRPSTPTHVQRLESISPLLIRATKEPTTRRYVLNRSLCSHHAQSTKYTPSNERTNDPAQRRPATPSQAPYAEVLAVARDVCGVRGPECVVRFIYLFIHVLVFHFFLSEHASRGPTVVQLTRLSDCNSFRIINRIVFGCLPPTFARIFAADSADEPPSCASFALTQSSSVRFPQSSFTISTSG